MSLSCLESRGCRLIPLYYPLFWPPAYSLCSSAYWLILRTYFSLENSSVFLLRDRRLAMAPVQQLGDDSWSVVCAAFCPMALVFTIMRLHYFFKNIFCLIIVSVHCFLILFYNFFNLVSINQTKVHDTSMSWLHVLFIFFIFYQG